MDHISKHLFMFPITHLGFHVIQSWMQCGFATNSKIAKKCSRVVGQQFFSINNHAFETQDINQSRIKKRLQAGREASPIRKPEPPLLLLVLPVKPACQPNVKPRKVNTHLPIPFVHL